MRQIATRPLWIGNVLDAANFRQLHSSGIQALVDLGLNEPVSVVPRELIYCRFPLLDGGGNSLQLLKLAVETTARLISAELPTLVFCSAGMSRSPAIAAAALAMVTNQSPEACVAEVFADGPADLSPALWADRVNVRETMENWPRLSIPITSSAAPSPPPPSR